MKANYSKCIFTCLTLIGYHCVAQESQYMLWYDKPATKWVEALPVGNGRLGAMVFGQPASERLQPNESTLWGGGPYDPVNPEAKEALPQVRQLINEAKYQDSLVQR